jgi:hypothetical protein
MCLLKLPNHLAQYPMLTCLPACLPACLPGCLQKRFISKLTPDKKIMLFGQR